MTSKHQQDYRERRKADSDRLLVWLPKATAARLRAFAASNGKTIKQSLEELIEKGTPT